MTCFSQNYACPEHGVSVIDGARPAHVLASTIPFGACETCTGLGYFHEGGPGARHSATRSLSINAGGHQGQRLVLCGRL